MKRKIKLKRGERILAVVPEHASGPGWVNSPTWVHIGANDGTYRTECIQPAERTLELHALWEVGESVHRSLLRAINGLVAHEKANK